VREFARLAHVSCGDELCHDDDHGGRQPARAAGDGGSTQLSISASRWRDASGANANFAPADLNLDRGKKKFCP
jgi:hypothetical protein